MFYSSVFPKYDANSSGACFKVRKKLPSVCDALPWDNVLDRLVQYQHLMQPATGDWWSHLCQTVQKLASEWLVLQKSEPEGWTVYTLFSHALLKIYWFFYSCNTSYSLRGPISQNGLARCKDIFFQRFHILFICLYVDFFLEWKYIVFFNCITAGWLDTMSWRKGLKPNAALIAM